MESSCSRSQLPNAASRGPRQATLPDVVHVEGGGFSRRHQRNSRQGSKSRSGSLDPRFHVSVTPTSVVMSNTSSSSSTSLPAAVRRPTNNGHAPAGSLLHFHSPETATNSTSSLPVETSPANQWTAEVESPKFAGLVRRKSDLGPIAESDRVATSNVEEAASRSLRCSGIQRPAAVVHRRGASRTCGHPSTDDGGERNLRTSSSADSRSQDGASGPQETTSSAARPRVLALSDHITCLRQKNLRRGDDVISSGELSISDGASEPEADNKYVGGARYNPYLNCDKS